MRDDTCAGAGASQQSWVRRYSTRQLFERGLVVRLRARLHRFHLDCALAAGQDPASSPLLAARAAQLADPVTRRRIAACLERFALTASKPKSAVRKLPLRSAVQRNQDALIELARMLRHGGLFYTRGIALLELVVRDGIGPAYTESTGEGLGHQLALAAHGLSGGTPCPAAP